MLRIVRTFFIFYKGANMSQPAMSQEQAMETMKQYIAKTKNLFNFSKSTLNDEVLNRLTDQYKHLTRESIVTPNDEQGLFVNFWATVASLGVRIQEQSSETLKEQATREVFENGLAFSFLSAFFHDCYNPLALDTPDNENAQSAAASVLGVGGVDDAIVAPLISTIGFIQNAVMAHHIAHMNNKEFRFTASMFADFAGYLRRVLDEEKAIVFDHAVQNVVSTLCTLRVPLLAKTPVLGDNFLGFNRTEFGDATIQEYKVTMCSFIGATCDLLNVNEDGTDLSVVENQPYQWNGRLYFIEFQKTILLTLFTDQSNGKKLFEVGSMPYVNETDHTVSAVLIPVI